MRKSTLDLLLDNLANLSNRIYAVETAFIDYTEESPKSSDQWQEERLRALEHQCKTLQEMFNQSPTVNGVFQDDFTPLQLRMTMLEERLDAIQQGSDAKIARLENQVAELGLALGNLSKELQDMKNG